MSNMQNALNKVRDLRNLPYGWNYGRGRPITRKAQAISSVTLYFLNSIGAKRFDVLPSDNGGATLLAAFGEQLAEIVVQRDGTLDLFLEAENCFEAEGLDFGELITALEDAGWKSSKSSGSHTHVFSAMSTEGSLVRLLPTMGLGRRWLQPDVPNRQVQRSATICEDITLGSEESHQYFSGFRPRALLMAQG